MKKIIISFALLLTLLLSMLAATYAWYSMGKYTMEPETQGSILGGFFAGGNGTEASPYQMTDPVHVYNLAWLQYLGEFNKPNADGEIEQKYFVLNNDIDMEGLIIPPIGTQDYPFVGNFNGNGKRISNFTVSNYVGKDENGIEVRPPAVTDLEETASVVGFFGVIGEFGVEGAEGSTTIKLVNGGKDAEGNTVNSIKDLTLDNFTVRADTANTLIGLLAGYVNGTVSNVGVGASSMVIGAGTAPFADLGAFTGFQNDEASTIDQLNAFSVFSLVGAAYKDVKWEELPTGSTVDGLFGGMAPSTDGAGFGESMDMDSLIRRLTYIYAENMKNDKSYPVNFGTLPSATDSTKFQNTPDYKTTSTKVTYLLENTVLPLNVNTGTMFAGEEKSYELKIGSATRYLYTTDYYQNNSIEDILNTNTGYIVGGGTSGGTSWIRARIQKVTGANGGIKNSLPTNATTITGTNSTDTNLQLFTVDINGTNSVIDKNNNRFSQYNKVVENFVKSFVESASSSDMMSGIRFFSTAANGISIDESGNLLSGSTTKNVSLYGKDETNYEMVNGAINFSLSGAGYVTAIAGTYYSETEDHSLFSLYQVERDDNNQITKVTKIETVWVKYNADGTSVNEIKYNLTNTSGYTCVFNSANMNNLTNESSAYYFEIPVIQGDYALGGAVGETNGAYLMYLDIGSSGDLQLGEGGNQGGDGSGDEIVHAISGVNFVKTGTGATSTADPMAVIRVAQNGTGTKNETVAYQRTSASAMTYTVSSAARFKIETFGDDGITITASS